MELKRNVGKTDATGTVIKEYRPETGGTLSDGTTRITIGISPRWQLRVGTIIGPLSNAKTPGGGKLTDVLQHFGFKGRQDGVDGDHVHEIQMGGEDVIANLWPLGYSPNRAAGGIIRQIIVHYPSGKTTTVSDLKATASTRSYYFRVVECKP